MTGWKRRRSTRAPASTGGSLASCSAHRERHDRTLAVVRANYHRWRKCAARSGARNHWDGKLRGFWRCGSFNAGWTDRYPRISRALAAIRTASAVIDGEAVCCDDAGVAVFEKLHSRAYDDQVFLYAFDLLELEGVDWRPRPLEERKAKLAKLLAGAPAGIQYSEHLEGDGAAIFAHACKLGCEGVVSKRADSAYRSGPSKVWLKVKNPAAPGRVTVPGSDLSHARP
jgi:hypothetical protein